MARIDSAGIDRRQFIRRAGGVAAAVGAFGLPGGLAASAAEDALAASAAEDAPNTHNMLVVGNETIYLSHLPMFDGLNGAKTGFRSPHRYQVILEAQFTDAGKDVGDLYRKDRQAHPATRIYTLGPSPFVLSRLFTPAGKPQVAEFHAAVTRGHLELPTAKPVAGLQSTLVKITRVVHGREFDLKTTKPAELEYLLFGKGSELFLAHAIVAPPDFDHVLAVTLDGLELKAEDLARGVRVVVSGRKNVAAERLRDGQRVPVSLRIGAGPATQPAQVVTGREFYFEEGELMVPPTFDPTPEEQKQ